VAETGDRVEAELRGQGCRWKGLLGFINGRLDHEPLDSNYFHQQGVATGSSQFCSFVTELWRGPGSQPAG